SVTKCILMSSEDDFLVQNNNIALTPFGSDVFADAYGIYLDACSDYVVEANAIDATAVRSGSGIIVENRSNLVTEIYRNFLDDLRSATSAVGDNRGLQFRCNDYIRGNLFSIVISGVGGVTGQLPAQGTISDPAGNEFQDFGDGTPGDCFNRRHVFRVGPVSIFDYYRHDVPSNYTPYCLDPIPPVLVYTSTDNIVKGDCDPSSDFLKAALSTQLPFEQLSAIDNQLAILRQRDAEADPTINQQIERLVRDKVALLRQDTDKKPLLNYLEAESHPYAKQQLFQYHFVRQNFSEANQALNLLQSDELNWQSEKTFALVLLSQAQAQRYGGDFSNQELQTILKVAEDRTPAGVRANKLLNRFFDGTYEEYIPYPDGNSFTENVDNRLQTKSFTLAPNPTSGRLDIQLQLANETANTQLEVFNLNGSLVFQREISPQNDQQFQINLDQLPQGIYIALIRQDGAIVEQQKFILAK
ncbi:MAG: T9SS type A sorting domain-containing protein, partial [Bacteroidota bacterium]